MASLKNVTAVKYDGTRQLHDLSANRLSKWLRRAKIPHMGGVGDFKRTCIRRFTGVANRLPEPEPDSPTNTGVLRYRQGTTPDLMNDSTSIDPSPHRVIS